MTVRNIRLIIEYDGTRYRGWQSGKRDGGHTVSGRIGEVLNRMTDEEITLFCGEKTETGVHALRQIANFKTMTPMSVEEIRQYLNRYLPLDIAVKDVEEVSERYHAELNPHQISYRYRMLVGEVEDVFQRRYVDFRRETPNIQMMKDAAEQLIGIHDFRGFSAGKTKKSTTKNLVALDILEKKTETGELNILLKANGFLKQMPQKIVATLLDIGYGKRDEGCIERIFEGSEPASANCVNSAFFVDVFSCQSCDRTVR